MGRGQDDRSGDLRLFDPGPASLLQRRRQLVATTDTFVDGATESLRSVAFVTSNAQKFATAKRHLERHDVELELVQIELEEPQSDSVEDIALSKAQRAYEQLRRPVLIEDSGFYIEELGGFPGPLVKYVLRSLGPEGLVRVADLTVNRSAYYESVVVFMPTDSEVRVFVDRGATGIIAWEVSSEEDAIAWSGLWRIFVPRGCSRPLSALTGSERARVFAEWESESAFAKLGKWLNQSRLPGDGEPQLQLGWAVDGISCAD